MGRRKIRTEFSFESLKGRDHSEHIGVEGRIILELQSRKKVWGYGFDSSGS
jgi:hypothetical protein